MEWILKAIYAPARVFPRVLIFQVPVYPPFLPGSFYFQTFFVPATQYLKREAVEKKVVLFPDYLNPVNLK